MRYSRAVLLLILVSLACGAEAQDMSAFLAQLPTSTAPLLNQNQALWLATMPLACLDHPHDRPTTGWCAALEHVRSPGKFYLMEPRKAGRVENDLPFKAR